MPRNLHPNDVKRSMLMPKRIISHKYTSITLTVLKSKNARALRMKLVDDLWNIGFWSVMRESALPTVARTMSIGEPILNKLRHAWYCQNDDTRGAEMGSIAVVALSSSKLME